MECDIDSMMKMMTTKWSMKRQSIVDLTATAASLNFRPRKSIKTSVICESKGNVVGATSSTRQQQPQHQEYQGGEEPPKTTVAVDRPGLIVSGERICILTGDSQRDPVILSSSNNDHQQNSHEPSKVSLRVEFQRNCPLRRSLSDRAAPKMAQTVRFQDTTRLTVKARSRGSLHDLFHPPINADATDDEMESLPPPLPTTAPPLLVLPSPSIRQGSYNNLLFL